jgi:hypothetical protein
MVLLYSNVYGIHSFYILFLYQEALDFADIMKSHMPGEVVPEDQQFKVGCHVVMKRNF